MSKAMNIALAPAPLLKG